MSRNATPDEQGQITGSVMREKERECQGFETEEGLGGKRTKEKLKKRKKERKKERKEDVSDPKV